MPPPAKPSANHATRVGRYGVGAALFTSALWTIHEASVEEGPKPKTQVALRRVHAALLVGDVAARVRDSAETALALSHPNIARTTEVVEEWDELAFVMARPEGHTLRELLDGAHVRGSALPVGVVVRIALEILAALEALHAHVLPSGGEAPLYPCDLSPENFLIDPGGAVRMLDVTTDRAITDPKVRRTLSSARYLAPERLETGKSTPASDVFAVGVLIWELLATKRLFGAKPNADVPREVLTGPVPRLDVPGVRAAGPVPTKLANVIAKALSRSPGGRFSSADQLGRALLEGASAGVASPIDVTKAVFALTSLDDDGSPQTARRPQVSVHDRDTSPPAAIPGPAPVIPPPPRATSLGNSARCCRAARRREARARGRTSPLEDSVARRRPSAPAAPPEGDDDARCRAAARASSLGAGDRASGEGATARRSSPTRARAQSEPDGRGSGRGASQASGP